MDFNYGTMSASVIYVLCVSLQLSAGLLLIGNTTASKHGIIKEYCAQHTAIAFNENGTLTDDSHLKETVRMTWISRIAFSYLTFGYLMSILGEIPSNKGLAFLMIFSLTAILIWVPGKIAKYKSERFEGITLDDIPLQGGVEYVILEQHVINDA